LSGYASPFSYFFSFKLIGFLLLVGEFFLPPGDFTPFKVMSNEIFSLEEDYLTGSFSFSAFSFSAFSLASNSSLIFSSS
jgi:hypothetical protein